MTVRKYFVLKSHQDSVGIVFRTQDPLSVAPVFSPRGSVAFFQLVLPHLTDGSGLSCQYVMEIFLGLACVCHHSEGKPSYAVEAAAIAQSSFWTSQVEGVTSVPWVSLLV